MLGGGEPAEAGADDHDTRRWSSWLGGRGGHRLSGITAAIRYRFFARPFAGTTRYYGSSFQGTCAAEREASMDYRDRHVVVTGGTGALGAAVVSALLEKGAVCHVPVMDKAEAKRFAQRGHDRVRLVEVATLADEGEVARFYAGVTHLWASIHIAGGFAMQPLAETGKTALMAQLEMKLVSAFLCCAAAVRAMKG